MAKTDPGSELAHYSLGLAFMERGEIARAQVEWKRTIEINPNYFNVLGLLGQSYLMQNSLREAEYYYTAAINADPHNVEAIYNLALIKEKLGNLDEALFYYERFLENPPPQFARFAAVAREKVQSLKPGDR
jgi:tetratricopeptide (TPR) repeat protein